MKASTCAVCCGLRARRPVARMVSNITRILAPTLVFVADNQNITMSLSNQLNVTPWLCGSIPFECGFVVDVTETRIPTAICSTSPLVTMTVCE